MPTTYLITGASRGLGRGLVEAYLGRPYSVVVAAVRDPTSSTSRSLHDIPRASTSSLVIVKINSTSETDAAGAVKELKTMHNIHALDIVIANAGIAATFPRVEDAQTSDLLEYYHVNVVGNIILFRAVLPLLQNSCQAPKFITMGSMAGTIGGQEQLSIPNAVYGPSKAALNWITKKIHIENEQLVAFPVHPGWVQTDGGNLSARMFGFEQAPDSLASSISGLVKVIDESTRESHSGKYALFDGTFAEW